jgi:pimeloyl-ACP methyl ester carboxylesterase/DNA-binding winged helix-turn-helix (wHTH) protein
MQVERGLAFDQFVLDQVSGELYGRSGAVPLTPRALAMLEYLAARPGRLISKRELLDALWPGAYVADGVLKVCVSEIRRALGDAAQAPRFIETAHRRGYRFIAPVTGAPRAQPAPGPPEPEPPFEVHYARSGDVNIAYQVLGNGPIDLVFVMGWVSHLDYFWREPSFARFLRRLASFSRLILFDKRGTGLSDPVLLMPTLEQRMDDVRAVMDSVGSRRAALLGVSEGGPMCGLFAATYPERTESLIMIGTYARRLRAPDYPWGPNAEQRDAFCRELLAHWGGPVGIEDRAPSKVNDAAFRAWWSTYLRMGASPAAAVVLTRMNAEIDVRHVLPTVRVPSLVLHRSGDRCLLVDEGRYVAGLIPDARFVELPGDDHLPFVGDQDAMLDEIERFLSDSRAQQQSTSKLATLLCFGKANDPTTREATAVDAIVAHQASRHGGSVARTTGDTLVAVFDGPARAIRCANAISLAARRASRPLRIGLHTGECDLSTGVARGIVADIGIKVAALAEPDEVLVSRTVVDLVAGSGIQFDDRGTHRLGLDTNVWSVFAVRQKPAASNEILTTS